MPRSRPAGAALTAAFFARDVDVVARALIGVTLTVGGVGGPIVETESYDPHDPASHAFEFRKTQRNAVMFGPPARAYVYRSYGIHWCLNFTCGGASAVLIRALAPEFGIATMVKRRGVENVRLLCSGPGRLCQALGVSDAQNGASLLRAPFALRRGGEAFDVIVGPRIGITRGVEAPRRYGHAGSLFVSKKFSDG